MVSKRTVYNLGLFAWALFTMGAVIVVYSGRAMPYVDPGQLPGGPPAAIGAVAASWLLGGFVVSRLKTRQWKAAGRAAGLEVTGGGLLSSPDLTGSVGRRTVRVRTRKKKTGSSGGGESGGSSKSTFTVVEADLNVPVEEGLLIGRGSLDDIGAGMSGLEGVSVDGEFTAVGGSEDVAREVFTREVRDALRAMNDEAIHVGDAGGLIKDAIVDMTDSRLVSALAGMAEDRTPGDETTVSTETKGMLMDAAEMDRRIEAVVAVADAYEGAIRGRL